VYTARNGLCRGLRRKGGFGFLPSVFYSLSLEEKFLKGLDLQGKVVYDVGAFTGLMAMYFARATGPSGRVVAFEPNPLLCNHIRQNFALNHLRNCVVMSCAVGNKAEVAELVFDMKFMGAGSVENMESKRIGQSKTSQSFLVNVNSLDNIMLKHGLPYPDFVKIDVQGFERQVLLGMKKIIGLYQPDLFVEVHGIPYGTWRRDNLVWIINFLEDRGYKVLHVESGQDANEMNLVDFQPDEHLYCRFLKGESAKTPKKA
jgi:FkbM family methyltransferase